MTTGRVHAQPGEREDVPTGPCRPADSWTGHSSSNLLASPGFDASWENRIFFGGIRRSIEAADAERYQRAGG